ncbi:MAG: prolyl oligopeptidase family serine peptidase [Planctomycetota bacterium]
MVAVPWMLIGLAVVGLVVLLPVLFTVYVLITYTRHIDRVFEHKPLFVAPQATPVPDAEGVEFRSRDGRSLRGSYLRSLSPTRKGVILFGHEYSANRWLCNSYIGYLRDAGYDLFTFDFCNHGESSSVPQYDSLQWVTEYEVQDVLGAVDFLQSRPDADPKGIGAFGVSKGGGSILVAAGRNPYLRAVVTDGAFPTHGTVTYYEMVWVEIYSKLPNVYRLLPRWYYAMVGEYALVKMRWRHRATYSRVERGVRRYGKRPLLMIHGGRDNYIKQEIAERLFALASGPKELWIVKGAKHNACLEKAGDAYREKVRDFFDRYIAGETPSREPGHRGPQASVNGSTDGLGSGGKDSCEKNAAAS